MLLSLPVHIFLVLNESFNARAYFGVSACEFRNAKP